MKRMLCLLVFVLLSVSCVSFAAEQFSLDFNVAVLSKYVGGLSGSTVFNDAVIQPMITLSHNPTGLYARGWTSYSSRGGYDSDYGDEINWYFGIRKKLAGFVFDAGVSYYDFTKFFKSKDDFYGVYLNTDFPSFKGVTPYLLLEGDGPIKSGEGGYLYRAGLRYSFDLPAKIPPLGIEASIAGHDGAYGARPEFISSSRLSFFTTINIWKIGISPQLNFQKRFGYSVEDGGLTKDEFWGGINISYQF